MEGKESKDLVNFGGLVAEDFVFGEVTKAKGTSFLVSGMEGILGLAFQSISVLDLPVFFQGA